jgi:hypothetical protein
MAGFSIFSVAFNGRNGTGAISIPELKVGDIRIFWNHTPAPSGAEALNAFGQIVTTDGELHQIYSNDNSAESFTAVFLRFT